MKTKNIIISGYRGFIAGVLAERLVQMGHTIIGLDKKDGTSTSNMKNLLDAARNFDHIDMIVHLGANCSSQISLREPATDFEDNAIGTFNVCEFARQNGNIPIIFNSTMKVYPGEDGIIPPYGLSKLVGEQYLQLYRRVYGTPSIVNRPSSVYGPTQDGSDDGGWFTWFVKASLKNLPITLYGDGTQSRDVLYIDDCIDLLVYEVENFDKLKNREFDFGGGLENEVSLNELLDELNYHNNIVLAPKLKGDVQRFVNTNRDAMYYMDWKPKVSWKEGLKKMLEAYEN